MDTRYNDHRITIPDNKPEALTRDNSYECWPWISLIWMCKDFQELA
jgi:hypothetical protein